MVVAPSPNSLGIAARQKSGHIQYRQDVVGFFRFARITAPRTTSGKQQHEFQTNQLKFKQFIRLSAVFGHTLRLEVSPWSAFDCFGSAAFVGFGTCFESATCAIFFLPFARLYALTKIKISHLNHGVYVYGFMFLIFDLTLILIFLQAHLNKRNVCCRKRESDCFYRSRQRAPFVACYCLGCWRCCRWSWWFGVLVVAPRSRYEMFVCCFAFFLGSLTKVID